MHLFVVKTWQNMPFDVVSEDVAERLRVFFREPGLEGVSAGKEESRWEEAEGHERQCLLGKASGGGGAIFYRLSTVSRLTLVCFDAQAAALGIWRRIT